MTGGDPNLSFLGKWQSEHRWRNNPSPRLACSLNFSVPGAVAAGLLCASNCALPPEKRVASPRRAKFIIVSFKIDFPSLCILVWPRRRAWTDLLYCYGKYVSRDKILYLVRNFASRCEPLRKDRPPNHSKLHQFTCEKPERNSSLCLETTKRNSLRAAGLLKL
jgi:hypothetical protein